jgi:hypothetical protein
VGGETSQWDILSTCTYPEFMSSAIIAREIFEKIASPALLFYEVAIFTVKILNG